MSGSISDRPQPEAVLCDVIWEIKLKKQPQSQEEEGSISSDHEEATFEEKEEEEVPKKKRVKIETDPKDKTLRRDGLGKIIESDWWVGTDYLTRAKRKEIGDLRKEGEVLDREKVAHRKKRIEEIAGKEAVEEAMKGMLESVKLSREMNLFLRERNKGALKNCTLFFTNNDDNLITDANIGDFRTAGQVHFFNLTTRSEATRGLPEEQRSPRPSPIDYLPRITNGSNKVGCYLKIGPLSEERGENTLVDIQYKREEHQLHSAQFEIDANDPAAIDFVFRKMDAEMGERSYSISMRKENGKLIILVEYYGSTIGEDGFWSRAQAHKNVEGGKQGIADIAFHGDPDGKQDLPPRDPPIPQTFTAEFYSLAEPERIISKGRMFVLENCLAVNAGAILSPDWLEFQRWRGGKIAVLQPHENIRANRAFPIGFSRTDPANDREPVSATRHVFSCGLSMHPTTGRTTIRPPGFARSHVSELCIPENLRSAALQTGGDPSRSFSLRVVKKDEIWTSQLGIKERFGARDDSSFIRSIETSEIDNHPKFVDNELRIAACRAIVYIRNQGEKGEKLLEKVGMTAEEMDDAEYELLEYEEGNDPKTFGEQRFRVRNMATEDRIPLRWIPPPKGRDNSAPCLGLLHTKKNAAFAAKLRLNLGGSSITKLEALIGPSGTIDKESFQWPYAEYAKVYDENGREKRKWRILFEDHPDVILYLNDKHFPIAAQRSDFSNKATKLLEETQAE